MPNEDMSATRYDPASQSINDGPASSDLAMGTEKDGRTRRPGSAQAGQAADSVAGATTAARDTAATMAAGATEAAQPAVGRARDAAYSQLASQKGRAADTISGLAQAIRQGGEAMQQGNQLPVGDYAGQAAQQLENVARMLNEKDVEQLVGEVETFARRQPALFLGGAFAVGLLLARFLKSSSRGDSLGDRAADTARSVVSQVQAENPLEERTTEPVTGAPSGGW